MRDALICRCLLIFAALLVVAGALLSGCSSDGLLGGDTGTVVGRIRDNQGNALVGATARCGGQAAVADRWGGFAIEDVPTGNKQVTASMVGFFDAGEGTAAVTVVKDTEVDAGELVLVPKVAGYVYLRELEPTQSTDDWYYYPDRGQATINGTLYLNSIIASVRPGNEGMNRYNLGRRYDRLEAVVGVDDNESDVNARVVFQFRGDGNILYTSPQLKLGEEAVVDLDISTVLNLEVAAAVVAGTAQSMWHGIDIGWGDARLKIK